MRRCHAVALAYGYVNIHRVSEKKKQPQYFLA